MSPLNVYLAPNDPLALIIRDRYFSGQEILSIPVTQPGPLGQCYSNVREQVRKHGGSEVYGWLLTVWPGRFVKALHHSVWKSPQGELKDVTLYAFPLLRGSHSTFIVDENNSIRTDGFDPTVPSMFVQLDDSAATRAYISATQNRTNAIGKMTDLLKSDGVQFERNGEEVILLGYPSHLESVIFDTQRDIERFSSEKNQACIQLNPAAQRLKIQAPLATSRFSKTQGANSLCACGSGKKYKRCHGK